MKRSALLRHLRRHGCHLKREGSSHSLWRNPTTGATEAVPRHVEIPNRLAEKICGELSVPENRRVTSQNETSADRDSPSTPVDMPRTEKPPRLPPQFELVTLDRTASVMDAALASARKGAGEGTLVWAREQTRTHAPGGAAHGSDTKAISTAR